MSQLLVGTDRGVFVLEGEGNGASTDEVLIITQGMTGDGSIGSGDGSLSNPYVVDMSFDGSGTWPGTAPGTERQLALLRSSTAAPTRSTPTRAAAAPTGDRAAGAAVSGSRLGGFG